MLKIEQVHREVRQTFQQNPGPKLIKICDKKVKKVRLNTTDKETSNNMMCFGEKFVMKGGQIELFPVAELIWEVYEKEEETNYIKKPFKDRSHLVDKKARVNIDKTQLIASAMKYYYDCDHYGEKDKTMNSGTWTDECQRYSEIEI